MKYSIDIQDTKLLTLLYDYGFWTNAMPLATSPNAKGEQVELITNAVGYAARIGKSKVLKHILN